MDLLCAQASIFTYYSYFAAVLFVWYLSQDVKQTRQKIKEVKQWTHCCEFNWQTAV